MTKFVTLTPEERLRMGLAERPGATLPTGQRYEHRLKARQEASFAAGVHPVSGRPLLGVEAATCGSCYHLTVNNGHAKTFYKCGLVTMTFGPKTDVRKKWPACDGWIPKPES